jgi:hypothetical protein
LNEKIDKQTRSPPSSKKLNRKLFLGVITSPLHLALLPHLRAYL